MFSKKFTCHNCSESFIIVSDSKTTPAWICPYCGADIQKDIQNKMEPSNKTIRLTRIMALEYEPDPAFYPEGVTTLEQMAQVDASADDPELMFSGELKSDLIFYEVDGKSILSGFMKEDVALLDKVLNLANTYTGEEKKRLDSLHQRVVNFIKKEA